jgi:hypothetical protein
MQLPKALHRDSQIHAHWQKICHLASKQRQRVAQYFSRLHEVHGRVSDELRWHIYAIRRIIEYKKCLPGDYVCEITDENDNAISVWFDPIFEGEVKFCDGVAGNPLLLTESSVRQSLERLSLRKLPTLGIMELEIRKKVILLRSLREQENPVNMNCVSELCDTSYGFLKLWKLGRLARLFVDYGQPCWLSPVRNLMVMDALLPSNLSESLRLKILDLISSTGSWGIPPNLFLEYALLPLLQIDRHITKKTEPRLDALFDLMRTAVPILDENSRRKVSYTEWYLTLKYLLRPLIFAKGKLLGSSLVYEAQQRRHCVKKILFCWRLLLDCPESTQVLQAHGRVFLGAAARMETIEKISEMLREFCQDTLTISRLSSAKEELDLRWVQQQNVFEYLDRSLADSPGRLLKITCNHARVLRILAEQDLLDESFYDYLLLLRKGGLENFDDFELYLEGKDIRSRNFHDAPGEYTAFHASFIEMHPTSQDRSQLVEFLNQTPILSIALFSKWKATQPGADRENLLESVQECRRELLTGKDGKVFFKEHPELFVPITCAIVDSPAISIDQVKADEQNDRDDVYLPIPDPLKIPRQFEVMVTEESETPPANRHFGLIQRFLNHLQQAKTLTSRTHLGLLEALQNRTLESLGFKSLNRQIQKQAQALRTALRQFTSESCSMDQLGVSLPVALQMSARAFKKLRSRDAEAQACYQRIREVRRKSSNLQLLLDRQQLRQALLRLLEEDDDSACRRETSLLRSGILCLLVLIEKKRKTNSGILLIFFSMALQRSESSLQMREPFYTLFRIKPDSNTYSLEQIECLERFYRDFCKKYLSLALASALRRITGEPKTYSLLSKHLGARQIKGADEALILKLLTKALGFEHLKKECDYLLKLRHKVAGRKKSMALVCSRQFLDRYFGHVGENCTSLCPEEILHKDFIPCRILDVESEALVGYIHILLKKRAGMTRLIVAGIEPKQKFLNTVVHADFYRKVREILDSYAKELAQMLLLPAWVVAHSNRRDIAKLMHEEIQGKELIKYPNLQFPRGQFDISDLVILWKADEIQENEAKAPIFYKSHFQEEFFQFLEG